MRDLAIKQHHFSMVTETKSPKRLISYIRMKMTQITDVNKQNKEASRYLFHIDNLKCLSKLLNPKEYQMRKNMEAIE